VKILHVSDAYLPKQGGIEVQVHDLASRQREAGHEVGVVTCAPVDHVDGDGRPGCHGCVPVVRLPTPWTRIWRTNVRLRAAIQDAEADVVHAHLSVLSPLSILAVRAAAKDGVPVVATLHSLWWFATPLYAIADLLVRWSRWTVQWTAVSELAAAPLRGVLRRHAEVSIMPNGIDPGDWSVDPLPRDDNDVLAVTVMRLAARKRPRALLKAFRQALDRLPEGRWSGTSPGWGSARTSNCAAPSGVTRSASSTVGPTSTSPQPCWSRSGSRRWRPAAPGCR
jgi:glycosyltransferase involved in cell wall biosynthesis